MNPSIELIRLIAVILITFTHTRNNLDAGVAYFIIEQLPTYGTAILSIISGYLYYTVSRKKRHLFKKKIKSLAIPYLIANLSVLTLVLGFNYVLGYNALNRLTYDFSLISEGVLALNSPPINPPTYFIRDIFIIFCIIALFTQKELKALLILVPILAFGTLILRMDVAFLFLVGCIYAEIKPKMNNYVFLLGAVACLLMVWIWNFEYLKFPLALLILVLSINLKFKFYNTGRFSYLLHLYHSPIMVISYPVIDQCIDDPMLKIVAQIVLAIAAIFVLVLITKKYKSLTVLSGGR